MIAVVAAWNVGLGYSKIGVFENMSLAGVEVLANGEGTDGCKQSIFEQSNDQECGDGLKIGEIIQVFLCSGGSGTGFCTEGAGRHSYNCDGSWLGYEWFFQTIERKEKGKKIDLDKTQINTEDYFLYSSMYKNIKTIVLETNESSIIGLMNKMRVHDPYIIILDSHLAKSVLLFDTIGRFVRKIGNVGSGPGEYTQPFDFTIDKDRNVIYVLDSNLSKINKYDISTGKFIHSIILDKNVHSYNIECIGGQLFADAYFSKHSDNNYLLRTIEEPSGKISGHFLNVREYSKGISNTSFIRSNVFYLHENGNAIFVQPFMEQIIEISKEAVSSLFEIKSKDLITSDIIKSSMEKDPVRYMFDIVQYNKYFYIYDFVEHGNMVQFNYQIGNQLRMIIYKKQTDELRIIQKRWDDLLFTNKGTSGVPATKFGCSDPRGVYYYYDTNQVERLKLLASNGALSPELDKLEELKNLDEDANPVIFYYEFKD